MNKIVTLNALRGNSYSLFRKIPLMINMGVCAFCLVPAMVFAENTHEVTVLNAQQQTRKAVGVVTDKTGEAIIGANVIVKGTTNGTITDMDGRFELDVPNNATLQVSYIGFNTQEIVFTGQPSIEVQLVDDTQALDEVVVTALGIKREKKALGYSMSELKGESLTQTRDANVANALAGKVAGLQITNAINTYTSGAFEDYDAEDVADLLKNRTDEAKKYFLETLDALDAPNHADTFALSTA